MNDNKPKTADPNFMYVTVTPYNPAWPRLFAAEAELLSGIMGQNLVATYHIGSTSVPGLNAKPIIDILPVVANLQALDEQNTLMEQAGYEALGEFGIPGRRYFRKGGQNRTHQIHAFQYNNTHAITRHLAFRGYLRCHPGVCAQYTALKQKLATLYPTNTQAYSSGKDAFVQQHEANALLWHWQTEVK